VFEEVPVKERPRCSAVAIHERMHIGKPEMNQYPCCYRIIDLIFWIAILSLIVIIRMKLREIERVQEMGADREDGDAPFLE
jgi:hypothetical protein